MRRAAATMSVSQSAEMTSPEGLHGELIQMALTFGIFTQESTFGHIIDFDHGGAGKLGTDFVSRVGDSRLDDHIAFAKVQQAGHQRHGLLGTHGGYGGSVDGFQIHPAQFAEPCIDSALRSAVPAVTGYPWALGASAPATSACWTLLGTGPQASYGQVDHATRHGFGGGFEAGDTRPVVWRRICVEAHENPFLGRYVPKIRRTLGRDRPRVQSELCAVCSAYPQISLLVLRRQRGDLFRVFADWTIGGSAA